MKRWWGYVDPDGGLHAVPFVSQDYVDRTESSGHARRIFEPFDAEDWDEAVRKLKAVMGRVRK